MTLIEATVYLQRLLEDFQPGGILYYEYGDPEEYAEAINKVLDYLEKHPIWRE